MKAAFPGLHILLYRNLFHQWCSYTEQGFIGNPYFLETIRKTLVACGHIPFLRDLHELFPLAEPSVDSAAYFWCFVFLHLYLYAHAACAADLVINVNRLAEDSAYCRQIEQAIEAASGVAVDLSGALRSQAYSLVHLGSPAQMLERLMPISHMIEGQAPAQVGSDFVTTAVSELAVAYAQYIAQAGPLIEVVSSSSGLLRERERLASERDARQAELDRHSVEHARLQIEIDRLASDCDRQQAESEVLAIQRDQLRIEIDRLAAAYDAILHSTSWRITRPVRLLGDLLK